MTVIEFEKVSKSYGAKVALNNLSLSVKKGEFVAFLGPNGAGKSTSLSLILGQRFATTGQVQVLGGKASDQKIKARIGATPQDLDFPVHLRCDEVVSWVAAHFPQAKNVGARIEQLKEQLNLEDFWKRETGGLSGGEKRRLGLMLALLSDPELLVLDEPTTGMDVNSRRRMWDVIRRCHKEGKTILLTTHYLDEVEELSDRVLVIDRGELLFSGTVNEIKKRVEYKVVDVLVADEAIQKFPGIFNWNYKKNRAQFLVRDSDAFIREMVNQNIQFQDLHVQPAKLEDAFVALRSET
jgi:ABC-2 type transport system ATP-binding protein